LIIGDWIFGDDVPAVVEVEGGGGACGLGDAAGLGVVVVSDERAACPYGCFDEAVFAVPSEDARRKT
jgi:hypothetical protein